MATATAPVAYEHAALTKEKALSHAPRAAFARRRAPRRRRRLDLPQEQQTPLERPLERPQAQEPQERP